jgi:hypothetical protein
MALPRPGIARKTALKTISLRRGKVSLARAPFHQRGLLKERVDGRFGLHLQVTAAESNSAFVHSLRAVAAVGVDGLGDLLGLGLQPTALRHLIDSPFDEIAEQIEDDSPRFAVEGSLDLDSESLPSGLIRIPLQLIERIRQSDTTPGPKARDQRKAKTTTYKKGLTIGEVVLSVSHS